MAFSKKLTFQCQIQNKTAQITGIRPINVKIYVLRNAIRTVKYIFFTY